MNETLVRHTPTALSFMVVMCDLIISAGPLLLLPNTILFIIIIPHYLYVTS